MKVIVERFCLFLPIILSLWAIESCDAELRLLMSIFRHGDRYPVEYEISKIFHPLNPHANVSWFPDSAGGLTPAGKRHAYEFGNMLREKYGPWLGRTYSKNLFEFRSSPVSRCAMTAALVAAGLFPPTNDQIWNEKLNWQPIPVSAIPRGEHALYYGPACCTNYYAKYLQIKQTNRTVVDYNLGMQRFYNYVSHHTGARVTNRILGLLDIEFMALDSGGLDRPEWANRTSVRKNFRDAATFEYILSSWNDDLKRISGGPWLKEWLDHVDDYLKLKKDNTTGSTNENGIETKKAFFYGGHEMNIAGILVTLGIYYRHLPNYMSAVNFELHEDDDRQFYVKVLHRDSDEFVEYVVPGCDDVLCPLDTFRKIFAGVTPKNLTEECGPYVGSSVEGLLSL